MVIIAHEYGTSISRKSNCLVLTNKAGKKVVSVVQISEIQIYPACSISSDAIELCMQNDVWIVFLDSYGNPLGEITPLSGGSSPILRRKQLLLQNNEIGILITKQLLVDKINNRINQLTEIIGVEDDIDKINYVSNKLRIMIAERDKIENSEHKTIGEGRASFQGYEGTAGKAYFDAVNFLLPFEMKFESRTRDAKDPFNSALNYLYGMMYAKLKRVIILNRMDPYIGIMHVDQYNKPTFLYDVMEQHRIICEDIIYRACTKGIITKKQFVYSDDKCILSEEGCKIIVNEFYKKMEQKVKHTGITCTVDRRIKLQVAEIAKIIEGKDNGLLAAI